MAVNDSDFAQPLSALSVQNPVTVSTSVSVSGAGANITGKVSGAGAIISGTGFTVAHPATGQYTITFTVAFSVAPIVLAMPLAGAVNELATAPTTTGCSIAVFNTITGAGIDEQFDFVAMPVA